MARVRAGTRTYNIPAVEWWIPPRLVTSFVTPTAYSEPLSDVKEMFEEMRDHA
jgi:hypothetical protein